MTDRGRRSFIVAGGNLGLAVCAGALFPIRAISQTGVSIVVDRQTAVLPADEDCTLLLQKAIDRLPQGGGEVVVLPGEYMIDPDRGIALRSHVHLRMSPGAVLRAKPTASQSYAIIRIYNATEVSVSGGEVSGERHAHLGTGGEWGMGIDVRDSHAVRLENLHIHGCWGDGIYIGTLTKDNSGHSSDIVCQRVVADDNRRQGLSVVACIGALIEHCKFTHTGGTLPSAGIDLEPNPGGTVENVRILDCILSDNVGDGIVFGGNKKDSKLRNCIIRGGTSQGNSHGVNFDGATNCSLSEMRILDNVNHGVYVGYRSRDCVISSNRIVGNSTGGEKERCCGVPMTGLLDGRGAEDVYVQQGAVGITLQSNIVGQ